MAATRRFVVGEAVRIAISVHTEICGKTCRVVAVGPFVLGQMIDLPNGGKAPVTAGVVDMDYVLDMRLSPPGTIKWVTVSDLQLQKLYPPDEPIAMISRKAYEP